MDWLGIGVLIIGIALLILVVVLIKPLAKLATVLDSVHKTTDRLPKIVDDNAAQAHTALKNVNITLENVNQQINAVHPLFNIVEDAGLASRQLSLKWLNQATAIKTETSEAQAFTNRQNYEGLYGVLSFAFFLFQNKDILTNEAAAVKKELELELK